MMHPKYASWLLCTVLIVSLTFSRSASQDTRANYNYPENWNYGDRTPLTGNRGNFYNPIFGTNGNQYSNTGPQMNGSRDGINRPQPPPHMLPGPQEYVYTDKPKPVQSVYPWSFQPSPQPRPQPSNTWSSQAPGQNNAYTPRPQPDNTWSTRPPSHSFTSLPSEWSEDRSLNFPSKGNEEFDLVDFQNLPASYKTAFMSVEELVRNNGMISPPGPNSRNVLVVFDSQTQEILNPALQSLVSDILPTLVPGTWRSMTFIQGCCSALRYHAANDTLVNLNGQQKKIVHFSKYSPPMYQFIPHGLCANSGYSTNGHCLQGTVTMSLLVYDLRFNPPLSFDIFSIPSYCNCVQF